MKTYYYAQTGHRIGLDRFRRAAALIKSLGNTDVTLLTSDFRIASVAKDFGVAKCVGIDVIRNIPQIAQNGDNLIVDSSEINPIMLEDMKKYFATLVCIGDMPKDECAFSLSHGDCTVDEEFYAYDGLKDIALTYFFGDDDYEKDLEKNLGFVAGVEAHLQLGFYYFLDYETMLQSRFKSSSDFEAYADTIKRSKVVLSASPQTVLESLACNAKPIYFQREDYTREWIPYFQSLNIPVIEGYDKDKLEKIVKNIDAVEYVKVKQNNAKIVKFIKQTLNL